MAEQLEQFIFVVYCIIILLALSYFVIILRLSFFFVYSLLKISHWQTFFVWLAVYFLNCFLLAFTVAYL